MQYERQKIKLNLKGAFNYLANWPTANTDSLVIVQFYKIDNETAYGRVSWYTYDYLVFEIAAMTMKQNSEDIFITTWCISPIQATLPTATNNT